MNNTYKIDIRNLIFFFLKQRYLNDLIKDKKNHIDRNSWNLKEDVCGLYTVFHLDKQKFT